MVSVPGAEVSGELFVLVREPSSLTVIVRISATFEAVQDVEVLTGLAFHGQTHFTSIGSSSGRRIEYEAGLKLRSIVVGIVSLGFVALKFLTARNDNRPEEEAVTFGSFDSQVTLGRLEPYKKDSIEGLAVDFAKVCHLLII